MWTESIPSYADDVALLSDDPDQLQLMLNVAEDYASRWYYSFGAHKSVIMVFGESTRSRNELRKKRCWSIGGQSIAEADSAKHLGVMLSVNSTTLHHTLKSAASARAAFYAATPYGMRFGCLHPRTALRLYYSLVRSILTFGYDAIMPTKSELLILERAQQSILRIILDVPSRTSSLGILAMMGALPIKSVIYAKHLSFLRNVLSMPAESAQRRVLVCRLSTQNKRSFVVSLRQILNELDLTNLEDLLNTQPPSRQSWREHVRSLLFINLADEFQGSVRQMKSLSNAEHLIKDVVRGKMAPLL
jgi:hypothetical protein